MSDSILAGTWAAIDLETTGLSPVRDRVCEVGVVLRSGAIVVEEWSSLVRAKLARPASRESMAVHGIAPYRLVSAPSEGKTFERLLHRLRRCTFVVAHHAAFDLAFLGEAFRRTGVPSLTLEAFCTLTLGQRLLPGLRSYELSALAEAYQVTDPVEHRALPDARIVAALFCEMANGRSAEELRRLHGPPFRVAWRMGSTRRTA